MVSIGPTARVGAAIGLALAQTAVAAQPWVSLGASLRLVPAAWPVFVVAGLEADPIVRKLNVGSQSETLAFVHGSVGVGVQF